MNAAMALRPLVDSAIGTDLPVRIDCWDGSSIGPTDADVVVRFRTRRALRRLVGRRTSWGSLARTSPGMSRWRGTSSTGCRG